VEWVTRVARPERKSRAVDIRTSVQPVGPGNPVAVPAMKYRPWLVGTAYVDAVSSLWAGPSRENVRP